MDDDGLRREPPWGRNGFPQLPPDGSSLRCSLPHLWASFVWFYLLLTQTTLRWSQLKTTQQTASNVVLIPASNNTTLIPAENNTTLHSSPLQTTQHCIDPCSKYSVDPHFKRNIDLDFKRNVDLHFKCSADPRFFNAIQTGRAQVMNNFRWRFSDALYCAWIILVHFPVPDLTNQWFSSCIRNQPLRLGCIYLWIMLIQVKSSWMRLYLFIN